MKSLYTIITDFGRRRHHLLYSEPDRTQRGDFDPENNIAHSPEKIQAYQKELEKKAEEVELINEAEIDEFYYRGGQVH